MASTSGANTFLPYGLLLVLVVVAVGVAAGVVPSAVVVAVAVVVTLEPAVTFELATDVGLLLVLVLEPDELPLLLLRDDIILLPIYASA